ncbi:MAG TPA: HEAT repeat domain-containing protein, partial [Thermoflexus sp.]|nr:HEAT repeat domain-containing protein [Thermoflexus sp.]
EAAAEALGKIGNPQAILALQEALKDENREMRKAAAWALGGIGNPQAIPALLKALKDESGGMRWAAAVALEKILLAVRAEGQGMETVLPYLPALIRTAARYQERGLLRAALELQAIWHLRRSRWRDPIQPSPFEKRLRRIGRFLILAGAGMLLGVLFSGAVQALQERLRPFWESLPWPLLVLLALGIGVLVALLERRRGR